MDGLGSTGSMPGGAVRAGRPITMVTAVWGDWHIDTLLRFNLNSLASPGNLPALSARHPIRFIIFTRASDLDSLRNSKSISDISSILDIEFRLMGDQDLLDPITAHHKAWARARGAAIARGDLLFLLPPDVVWSHNAMEFVTNSLEQGCQSIFMTYLRVVETSFLLALETRRSKTNGNLALTGRELVHLALKHLHPLMASHMRNARFFTKHPEMLISPVSREGVSVRLLVREMFLFDPRVIELNDQSLPVAPPKDGKMVVATDSDDLFAVGLAEFGKDSAWHNVPRQADEIGIARWWLVYDSPFNDALTKQSIRWHQGTVTEEKWRRVERGEDLFIRRLAVTREGLRVWRAAHSIGCIEAAAFIALMITSRIFARLIRGDRPAYVFLPNDSALNKLTDADRINMFQSASKRRLGNFLRAHYALANTVDPESKVAEPILDRLRRFGTLGLDLASSRKLVIELKNGKIFANGVVVDQTPVRAGRHLVYRVGDLFDSLGTVTVAKSFTE